MSRITAFVLAVTAISSSFAAEVVVEERTLHPNSSSTAQTQAIPTSKPLQSQALAESAPSMQWQIYQQVQQLQQEVRDLRGQLEVQANIIERMKQDAKSRYLDLDQRITDLKNRPLPSESTTNSTTTATTPTQETTSTPVATVETPTASDTATAAPAVPNPDDGKRAYFAAYQVFKTGGPNKAINPMRNFIKTYPQSTLIPSAYYWLGEFYLAASPSDVSNAKKSFRIVAEQFSSAPKAASALLKLGSFADVDGKTPEAIKYMLKIIKDFPSSEEAKAAKSYLTAQNVPIPADKAEIKTEIKTKTKAKTDSSKTPATTDKAKAPAKDGKTKPTTDKAKTN